jgi:hypothetical protein
MMMTKAKRKGTPRKKASSRDSSRGAEAQVIALPGTESASEPASSEKPATESVANAPETPVKAPKAAPKASKPRPKPDKTPKKAPIGWTPELSAGLKAAMTYQELALEIDREAGHLAAGLVALFEGQFELAALNLWNAGLAEAPPPTVEEGFS